MSHLLSDLRHCNLTDQRHRRKSSFAIWSLADQLPEFEAFSAHFERLIAGQQALQNGSIMRVACGQQRKGNGLSCRSAMRPVLCKNRVGAGFGAAIGRVVMTWAPSEAASPTRAAN